VNGADARRVSVAARARREAARVVSEAIDRALLRPASNELQRVLALLKGHDATSAADRVRLRAKRLAKVHAAQRSRIPGAADMLVRMLYCHAAPDGWLCAWCDASVAGDRSPPRVGVGAVILDEHGRELARISRPLAECAPFEAEIAALEATLLTAAARGAAQRIRVHTDCDALVSLWLRHRSDPRLRAVRELARELRRFELRRLPRRHNQLAHRLARDAAAGAVGVRERSALR
jgi:ribonuclease HI